MLGSNAKEREYQTLHFLSMNKHIAYTWVDVARHADIRVGPLETLEDLRDYGLVEIVPAPTIMGNAEEIAKARGKSEDEISEMMYEITRDRYQITEKGIRYIEEVEFNKEKEIKALILEHLTSEWTLIFEVYSEIKKLNLEMLITSEKVYCLCGMLIAEKKIECKVIDLKKGYFYKIRKKPLNE